MRKTAKEIADDILSPYYYSDPLTAEQAPLMAEWDDRLMGGPWPKHMLPVAGNGFGDMAVRDLNTKKLYEYLHERASKEEPFTKFRQPSKNEVFDKARWHPKGAPHLAEITKLLRDKNLLSPEGLEASQHVDSEYSIPSSALTDEGRDFMYKNYHNWQRDYAKKHRTK